MAENDNVDNSAVHTNGLNGEVSVNAAGAEHVDGSGSDSVYADALGDHGPVTNDDVQNEPAAYGGSMFNVGVEVVNWEGEEPLLCVNDIEILIESPGDMVHDSLDGVLREGMEITHEALDCSLANEPGNISRFANAVSQDLEGVNGGSCSVDGLLMNQVTGHGHRQNNQDGQPEPLFQAELGRPPAEIPHEEPGPASEGMARTYCHERSGPSSKKRSEQQKRNRSSALVKKTYELRSSGARPDSFQSRGEETPDVLNHSSTAEAIPDTGGSKKRKRRRKRQIHRKPVDEFSKMRNHLRYLLHRVKYEQNLIDAYSSEGWRGQSLEKLRPEKELDRAKSAINRFKLKIRALFQQLDQKCADGRFPESLYDSEGMIDSEDIYCAKCGSKEAMSTNDIILCDGVCERGFHQFCLDPPLRTEEIPPGDEGWLCPACDCKVDCVDLLNDSEGTKLSINDSCKNVFPEAAASGDGQDDSLRLPSDDSEDDDYDPNRTVDGSGRSESASTSDESDFSSASEDLEVISRDDQNHDPHSDDSEDDDYDPEAPDADDQVNLESSSSDFTSASEDLGASIADNETLRGDGRPESSFPEPNGVWDHSLPVSSRRVVQRLDYKKLYEETYQNASSDSSDDEEWKEMVEHRNKRTPSHRAASVSSDGDSALSADRKTKIVPCRKTSSGCSAEGLKVSQQHLMGESPKSSSCGKKSPYKRLGEAVTQSLYACFKENQYPDKVTKKKLAKELGLQPKQVSKWFENARWSHNHPHPSIPRVVSKEGGKKKGRSSLDIKAPSTPRNVACKEPLEGMTSSNVGSPQCGRSGSAMTKFDTAETQVQISVSTKSGMTEDDMTDRTVLVLGLGSPEKVPAGVSSHISESRPVRTPSLRRRKASGA